MTAIMASPEGAYIWSPVLLGGFFCAICPRGASLIFGGKESIPKTHGGLFVRGLRSCARQTWPSTETLLPL
eukprot:7697163-Alexandrium_andersonii.AAC.1